MFQSPAGMTLACRTNKAEGPLHTTLQSRDGQQPLMEQCQQEQVCCLHTGILSVNAGGVHLNRNYVAKTTLQPCKHSCEVLRAKS